MPEEEKHKMMVEYLDKAVINLQSQREQFLADIEKLQT